MKVIAGTFALLAAAAFQAQPRDDAPFTDSLSLTHFDVGQGDATLITTAGGRHILIDAGPSGSGVAARLKQAGIDTLDLVVSTHNDADHIGGLADVFANLVVRKYVDNDAPCRTHLCTQTRTAATLEGVQHMRATFEEQTLDGVSLRFLPPHPSDSSESRNSIGVLVEYGSFSALYAGDADALQQQWWLSSYFVTRVDLLLMPRHGGTRAINTRWMAVTQPTLVVVSVGKPNTYAYPSWLTMELWKMRTRVMRTDTDGTVEVHASPDGSYSVETNAS